MWFCNKCNEWYNDSVTILKHFQNQHPTAKFSNRKDTETGLSPMYYSSKAKMSILKTKPTSLLAKSKLEALKLNKRFLNSKFQSGRCPSPKLKKPADNTIRMQLKNNFSSKTLAKQSTEVVHKNIHMAGSNDKRSAPVINRSDNKNGAMESAKTYICKYCCRRFPGGGLLQAHVSMHGNNPVHACHICGLTTGTFSALMSHYVKHSGLQPFDVTNFTTDSNAKINKPLLKKSHNKSEILCTKCLRSFQNKNAFNSHYCPTVVNKKNEYVCGYCHKVTLSVQEYRDHIQSHSQYACQYCHAKFKHKLLLDRHFDVCSKKVEKKSKSFSFALQLTKHNDMSKLCAKQKSKENIKSHSIADTKTAIISKNTKKDKIDGALVKAIKKRDSSIVPSDDNKQLANVSQICSDVPALNTESCSSPPKKKAKFSPLSPKKSIKCLSPMPKKTKCLQTTPKKTKTSITKINRPAFKPESKVRLSVSAENLVDTKPKTTRMETRRQHLETDEALIPTRRSARLVNRKQLDFSKLSSSGDESSSEKEVVEEKVDEEKVDEVIIKREPPDIESDEAVVNLPDSLLPEKKENSTDLFCNLCSLTFRCSSSLRRHKKMHTGKPQYACQYCGKFFFRKDIHQRHESSVHQNTDCLTFVCYYCKKEFGSSLELQEHAFDVHEEKALTPERIRRCANQVKKVKIEICDTSNEISVPVSSQNKSTDILDNKSPLPKKDDHCSYNCGICHAFFADAESLIKHFDIIHGISGFLNAACLEQYKSNVSGSSEVLVELSSASQNSQTELASWNVSSLRHATKTSYKNDIINAQPQEIPSCVSEQESNQKANCKFHVIDQSEKNLEKANFNPCVHSEGCICNEELIHKAVDFYQCAVCSVNGTQKQVQEHMLTHMLKLGTFIVSVEDKNLNSMFPYLSLLQNGVKESECNASCPKTLDKETDTNQGTEVCNSVCTLMEEVQCRFCCETIIDLQVLMHHQCLDVSSDPYMCFVNNCDYRDVVRNNVENHLKDLHFIALYSDPKTPPEMMLDDVVIKTEKMN